MSRGNRRYRRQTKAVIRAAVIDRNTKRAIRPALPAATPKVRIVKGHKR